MGFYSAPAAAGGSTVLTNSAQTASFTAAGNTIYSVNATSAAVTATLPASGAGQTIIVKKTDAGTNAVTLSGTINGTASSTYSIGKQFQSKQLYADGSGGWNIIAGDIDIAAASSTASATGFLSTVGSSKMTIGTTAPSSPAVGDLWIDTN